MFVFDKENLLGVGVKEGINVRVGCGVLVLVDVKDGCKVALGKTDGVVLAVNCLVESFVEVAFSNFSEVI